MTSSGANGLVARSAANAVSGSSNAVGRSERPTSAPRRSWATRDRCPPPRLARPDRGALRRATSRRSPQGSGPRQPRAPSGLVRRQPQRRPRRSPPHMYPPNRLIRDPVGRQQAHAGHETPSPSDPTHARSRPGREEPEQEARTRASPTPRARQFADRDAQDAVRAARAEASSIGVNRAPDSRALSLS